MTALCRHTDMPSLNTLQRWRGQDAEFDDRCWSAEAQGVMIKRSSYIEQMKTAIAERDPGNAIKMQGFRELLNGNSRTAGRLVSRMSDRTHVSVDKSVPHIIVGWANGDATVKHKRTGSKMTTVRIPFADSKAHKTDICFKSSLLRRIGVLAIGRVFAADISVSGLRVIK